MQSVVEVTVSEKEPEVTEPVTPVAPRLIVSPLSGETVAAFSMDELAYSETLADWRTHDGIDIKADAGTQVLAASSGTVLSVADDDLMGSHRSDEWSCRHIHRWRESHGLRTCVPESQ